MTRTQTNRLARSLINQTFLSVGPTTSDNLPLFPTADSDWRNRPLRLLSISWTLMNRLSFPPIAGDRG
jgi:hypothetical protein